MKKNFAEIYAEETALRAAYKAAANEEAENEARRKHRALMDGNLAAFGKIYEDAYGMYRDARDNGNDRPDADCSWHRDAGSVVEAFRQGGVREFTFSGSSTTAMQTAWDFVRHGCELKGMEEINCGTEWDGSQSKRPALVFAIK